MNYQQITLHKKRERSVIHRHPWLFSGAVAHTSAKTDGEIVQVRDFDKHILGYGFFSNKSQIVCRMFDWTNAERTFDLTYWKEKIALAIELRKEIIDHKKTTTYRLLHAEGDFIPGIIADVYGEVIVLQILTAGTKSILPQLIEAFTAHGFQYIYLKHKQSSSNIEGVQLKSGWLTNQRSTSVEVVEHGVKFWVDVEEGQKTGFFIDQRDNRQMLRELSKDKTVLNTFSYSGGFSVYALAGGAKEVHSVDISASAIEQGDRNVALNAGSFSGKHESKVQDCFDYLSEMPENFYDLIVLDPPAFAKHARAVANASQGYKQINLKAFKKIKPGGIVFTFSCSQNISKELFQKIVFGAAADARRNVRIIQQLHQPADHPVNIYHPEGEYLKGLVLWVE
ncbi:MAG: SAM-dependent methyltransferase [Cytophagaceae bacterium]|jgi:23S rRNA (cytosine1962-C5)-methyltransferase|nr:SAM-dependent methyltransferase [Cytophagaceae bacterium]